MRFLNVCNSLGMLSVLATCTGNDEALPQREILELFYTATGGDNWREQAKMGWMDSNVPECDWDGVTCGSNNLVSELFRSGVGMDGTIPTELGDLTYLTKLVLSGGGSTALDNLKGTIPLELAKLTALERFDAGFTMITGSIPPELFISLPDLKSLGMSHAGELTGSIPTEIGLCTKLTSVSFNSCTKLVSTLPSELGQLVDVFELILQDIIGLTGPIPTELGNMASLRRLFLGFNSLMGTIPNELSALTSSLTGGNLHLQGNQLSGTVPQALCDADINNGHAGIFGCDAIACAIGTYQNIGIDEPTGDKRGAAYRSNGEDKECTACPSGLSTFYIGGVSSAGCVEIVTSAPTASTTAPPTTAPTPPPTSSATTILSTLVPFFMMVALSNIV